MYEVCLVAGWGNPEIQPYQYGNMVAASDFVADVLHGNYMPVLSLAAVQINRGSECVYSYMINEDDRANEAEACCIDMWIEAESDRQYTD